MASFTLHGQIKPDLTFTDIRNSKNAANDDSIDLGFGIWGVYEVPQNASDISPEEKQYIDYVNILHYLKGNDASLPITTAVAGMNALANRAYNLIYDFMNGRTTTGA